MSDSTTGGGAAAPPEKQAQRARGDSPSPMMAQYHAIKASHPDSLLFYRMGDFYELFFDDAVAASAALDITLTKRGRHNDADIPMCGVPVHAADTYLQRLITKGFRVAVCEQTEAPEEARKRGGKAVVARDVVRVITAGTITEDSLLDARRNNFLAALAQASGALGLAWIDVSTGDFKVMPVEAATLDEALAGLEPGEILVPEALLTDPALFDIVAAWKKAITPSAAADSRGAEGRLKALYGVAALDGFGDFSRAETAACGALVDYLELTQKGRLPYLKPPARQTPGGIMAIDAATRRNLELTRSQSGERMGSLLGVIDHTLTGPGARLLAARLTAPLTDTARIGARLDAVAYFVDTPGRREDLRNILKSTPDINRALSRLGLGRGGPRDLAGMRDGLRAAASVRRSLAKDGINVPPEAIAAATRDLGQHQVLTERLDRALAEDLPVLTRDGGFIAPGYRPELDELRLLNSESRRLLRDLERRYRDATHIGSLKVRHNNVLGWFVETTPVHGDKLAAEPHNQTFIHRQTLASAVRFTTTELGDLESRIRSAADRALALELALFDDLVGEVRERSTEIALAASALAVIDVSAGLAEVAVARRYVRPVVDDSAAFDVAGGRHAMVEAARASGDTAFVANDCNLGARQRLWLVTGPNMAGKSTFLRQNALIVVLAQAGAYVPAEAAHIGVVDRLFSRVGAADDLARGRSTFMVEMIETAAILNRAGERSLVILDEIGRGTATFDGLSIAWASIEHLHEVNTSRALFATHYHELTMLSAKLARLRNVTMRIKEWQGEVVFLHEVVPGAAEGSYGIAVARLAGVPAPVIARAEAVLKTLERGEQGGAIADLAHDLPLFATTAAAHVPENKRSAIEDALAAIRPDELTPREALEALYRLCALLGRAD
jgi:DNA mismatch repair protein MutS